jgi:23S rRNA G2445 N2-methylase RlmL
LINGDFEKIAHQVLNTFEKFNILTNLPYGIRSSNFIQKNELDQTYTRFSKFLKKNFKKLNKVFVITTEHFIKHSQKTDLLKWTLKLNLDNNGINVGLYELEGEIDYSEL